MDSAAPPPRQSGDGWRRRVTGDAPSMSDIAPPPCQSADGWRRWVTWDAPSMSDIAPPPCQSADGWRRWVNSSGGASPAGTDEPSDLGEALGSEVRSISELSGPDWECSSEMLPPTDSAVEKCLKRRVESGDRRAVFYLGQLHFDAGDFQKAKELFLSIAADNLFAQYQLGVMLFEGLGFEQDFEKGFRLMLTISLSVPKTHEHEQTIHKAQFNVARAYFTGFGTVSSEDDGRRWLDRAAANGSRLGSVRAQTMLAMLLARRDRLDLKKSFVWHSEATGNGSLESQGALGVMYLYGLGVRRDLTAARLCLTHAARRGNIHATGQLCLFYYTSHFYRHAARFAAHLARFEVGDVERLARQTDCLARHVRRGLATGCFVLARCLQRGEGGLAADPERARREGTRAVQLDVDTADRLQSMMMHGPRLRSPE